MRRPGVEAEPPAAGFVTVAVVGLAAVLVGTASLLTTLGVVAVARHRAASAADLAALAGARHLLDGSACSVARSVAAAQGAYLVACSAGSDAVSVVAAVDVGLLGSARARARAGPVGGNQLGLQVVPVPTEGHLGTLPAPRGPAVVRA